MKTTGFARAAAALLLMLPLGQAKAGSDAAIVYGDDLTPKGETGVEMYAELSRLADVNGKRARQAFHALGEFSYGLGANWDAAIRLPVTRVGGTWHADGAFAEFKYIAPHGASGWYVGAELETGRVSAPGLEASWVVEAMPILGYRTGRWHFLANPGLEYSSDEDDHGWAFQPRFKASYQHSEQHAFGLEYFIDAGPLKELTSRSRRNEVAYLSWDTRIAKHKVSAGIGRGTTPVSPRWSFKLVMELDD
ncbi:MAG: hypothetical protein ACJ8GW_04180 [Massilia sp.]